MQYFSDEAVRATAPPAHDLIAFARDVIHGLRDKSIAMAPRPTIEARSGVRFMAFPAILEDEGIAGVKWLGITSTPSATGRVGSIVALSRIADAQPFAILDARWITAIRTAVVSLVAGLAMARADSRSIAFLACGEQASLHLELFSRFFDLRQVATYSRTLETAERFAERARSDFGCAARAFSSIRECVAGADIVITSTPAAVDIKLRSEWLTPTCFFSLVDLGRSFASDTLRPDALFAVDDIAQFSALAHDGRIAPFDAVTPTPLAALLEQGDAAERQGGFLMPTGLGAIDIRIAYEIFRMASASADVR